MPLRLLHRITALLFLVLTAAAPAQLPGRDTFGFDDTQAFGDSRDRVTVTVKAARTRIAQGGDLPVVIVFDHQSGWHIWTDERPLPAEYADFEYAIRTSIKTGAAPNDAVDLNIGFITWPQIHKARADVGDGPADYAVFSGRAIAYLPVTIPATAPIGPATLTFEITFQACDDRSCAAPATLEQTIDLEIVASGTPPGPTLEGTDADFRGFPSDVFGRIRKGDTVPEIISFDLFGIVSFNLNVAGPFGFILLLLVSAFGGFLLNLTPCVLPVIPIKMMSLNQSAQTRGRTLWLGTIMSLGVIGFWMGLAIVIASVAWFTATNQLFQYPVFAIGTGLFIAVLAVGMCGVFGIRLPQKIYMYSPKLDSVFGSFMFGIMIAVLSTPCTAPFMGAAAAWAAPQSPVTILSVFAAIGVGMAMPYQVLSIWPHLAHRMPRTGPASELIKQVMGLLMLAAAAYFVGVGLSGLFVSAPNPPSRVYWWFVSAFGVMSGGWLIWRTLRLTRSIPRRAIFGGVGLFILALSGAIGMRLTEKGPIDWIYYTPERFAQAKADGQVVVMEFTAEWCLNCHALEQSVLRSPRIVQIFEQDDVVPIKVDLTGDPKDANAMLHAVGRLTIPLLVVFRPDGVEIFKGDYYTVQQVLDAVSEAKLFAVVRTP